MGALFKLSRKRGRKAGRTPRGSPLMRKGDLTESLEAGTKVI